MRVNTAALRHRSGLPLTTFASHGDFANRHRCAEHGAARQRRVACRARRALEAYDSADSRFERARATGLPAALGPRDPAEALRTGAGVIEILVHPAAMGCRAAQQCAARPCSPARRSAAARALATQLRLAGAAQGELQVAVLAVRLAPLIPARPAAPSARTAHSRRRRRSPRRSRRRAPCAAGTPRTCRRPSAARERASGLASERRLAEGRRHPAQPVARHVRTRDVRDGQRPPARILEPHAQRPDGIAGAPHTYQRPEHARCAEPL